MIIFLLLLFLFNSHAVTIRRDKSILFSRIVIVSLFLTSYLSYNCLYFYEGLFNINTLLQLLSIAIIIIAIIYYLVTYSVKSEDLPIILSYVSTIVFIVVIQAHKSIFAYVSDTLDLGYYYLIPLLLIKILIATYFSVKNKCSLPGILSLFCIILFTVVFFFLLPLYSPLYLPLCIGLPIIGTQLQDVKVTAFFNEEGVNNYNFMSDKNWTLSQGKGMFNRKMSLVEKHYSDLINSGLNTETDLYTSKYLTLYKARIELYQIGSWLCGNPNGLDKKNLPRLIGPETNIPCLKEHPPLPQSKNRTDYIDRRFR